MRKTKLWSGEKLEPRLVLAPVVQAIGFALDHYANVTDPTSLTHDAAGVFYTGRDNSGSGGLPPDPVRIHRINTNGVASQFGPVITDPDSVVFDGKGDISGVAGSIIVGQEKSVTRIAPNGAAQQIFSGDFNIQGMVFDPSGRLLLSDWQTPGRILVSTDGISLATLVSYNARPFGLAVDTEGRIFSVDDHGTVHVNDSDGSEINASLIREINFGGLDIGPGGRWGNDLYAVTTSGELVQIDPSTGASSVIVTGIGREVIDLNFGTDDALYISEFENDRILRLKAFTGITLSTTQMTVSETGTTKTISVVLDWKPVDPVIIKIANSNTSEVTTSKTELTFTADDWDTPQTISVTGVDDEYADGNQSANVSFSVDINESDETFAEVADHQLEVINEDNEVAGFNITQSDNTTRVQESGTSDEFDVVLKAKPESAVVIKLTNPDESEVSIDKTSLTFTTSNWDTAQTVTATGVDDDLDDGDEVTFISLSIDDSLSADAFEEVPNQNVVAFTIDDDETAIELTESNGSTLVSEKGSVDSIHVVLLAQPTSNVVIDVSSSDASEATTGSSGLTFTADNWDLPQTVTISGKDDSIVDGDSDFTIRFSVNDALTDNAYDRLADLTIDAVNEDDEVAGFIVTETEDSTAVDESGTTDSLLVRLTDQPLSDVVLRVVSNAPDEVRPNKAELTFTPQTWDDEQELVLLGLDDSFDDGDQEVRLTLMINLQKSDDLFDEVANQSIIVIVEDDDTAGIEIEASEGSTIVTEAGSSDELEVALTAQPETDVILNVESMKSEVTVDKLSLRFTTDDWDTPQILVVRGADDDVDDGDKTTPVTLSIDLENSDDSYLSVDNVDVDVITQDDDTAGFTIIETDGSTIVSETGTSDAFSIVLNSQPINRVVLSISISKITEIVGDTDELIFDSTDWDQPKSVSVTGVNDHIVDGNEISTVSVSVIDDRSDPAYHSVLTQSVLVVNASLFPWRNPRNPLDVNDDGALTPLDALLVINFLNANGSLTVPIPRVAADLPGIYLDVNGDNLVAPVDSLGIINALNSTTNSEGEIELPQLDSYDAPQSKDFITAIIHGLRQISADVEAHRKVIAEYNPWEIFPLSLLPEDTDELAFTLGD